jgi:hypothetical protein
LAIFQHGFDQVERLNIVKAGMVVLSHVAIPLWHQYDDNLWLTVLFAVGVGWVEMCMTTLLDEQEVALRA